MNRVAVFMCLCYLVGSCNTFDDLDEGSACTVDEAPGVCISISQCPSALAGIKRGRFPKMCCFSGSDPIVCCLDNVRPTEAAVTTEKLLFITSSTTPVPTTSSAPEAVTMFETKFLGKNGNQETETAAPAAGGCPPIPANQTAPKTGQKAWDKCIEYQEKLVLPCDAEQGKRRDYCRVGLNLWILDGVDAYEGEFPHMALVGFGTEAEGLSFLCGGSLISESFVLTAGHCMSTRELGRASHVLLGILKRSEYSPSNLHRVSAVHKHPQYTPPKKYNDIALLELESPVTLTDLLVPACLDLGDMSTEQVATATGWGATQLSGPSSDVLQKVDVTRFPEEECSRSFPTSRHLAKGLDSKTQLCYGDRTSSKDTCQGDSGGPLQVKNKNLYCMYTVVGVTSFGRMCGVAGQPALYTRVAHYLPWIESIVWPDAQ